MGGTLITSGKSYNDDIHIGDTSVSVIIDRGWLNVKTVIFYYWEGENQYYFIENGDSIYEE